MSSPRPNPSLLSALLAKKSLAPSTSGEGQGSSGTAASAGVSQSASVIPAPPSGEGQSSAGTPAPIESLPSVSASNTSVPPLSVLERSQSMPAVPVIPEGVDRSKHKISDAIPIAMPRRKKLDQMPPNTVPVSSVSFGFELMRRLVEGGPTPTGWCKFRPKSPEFYEQAQDEKQGHTSRSTSNKLSASLASTVEDPEFELDEERFRLI